MRTEAKAAVKNSIGRLMFAALGFVIQVVWIIMLCLKLNDYSAAISLGSSVLALCVAFYIYGKDMNEGFNCPGSSRYWHSRFWDCVCISCSDGPVQRSICGSISKRSTRIWKGP